MKPNYEWKSAMNLLRIKHLRKGQIKPIQSLMDGIDTLVIAPTSFGKSAIYQIPALCHSNQLTIVVEPTLSLMHNQVQILKEHKLSADYIDHLMKSKDINSILNKVRNEKLTFLYVTPERLQNRYFQEIIKQSDLYMLVIDECYYVTEWEYTFRNAYLQIGNFLDNLSNRPVVLACSATILDDKQKEIINLLHLRNPKSFRMDLKRDNLILIKKNMTSEKKSLENRLQERFKMMVKYIKKYKKDSSVIVYALTTGYVDSIYSYLSEIYPNEVARYHSQIKSEKIKRQMEMDFLTGKKKIIVATTAFGMGIDVSDISLALHFNMPINMTDYIQQIGRAGRDGRKAHCVLFYDYNDDDKKITASLIKKFAQKSKAEISMRKNYQQISEFIDSTNCMMRDVLFYQGQEEEKSCKRCTNCAKKRRGNQ